MFKRNAFIDCCSYNLLNSELIDHFYRRYDQFINYYDAISAGKIF